MHHLPAAMSVNEAASYLGISRANLYRLFKHGTLKPAKIGGRTLVRRIDADALLEQSLENPKTEPKPRQGVLAGAKAGIWG